MSAGEQEHVRSLAGRIASRLSDERARESSPMETREASDSASELAALRATVSDMRRRLAQIESRVGNSASVVGGSADKLSGKSAAETRLPQSEPRAPSQSGEPMSSSPGEQRAASKQTSNMPPHWLSGTYVPAVHPSEERFGIDEAVSELVEFFEREKVCNVEPGGKPCDHCGMCSSRGF